MDLIYFTFDENLKDMKTLIFKDLYFGTTVSIELKAKDEKHARNLFSKCRSGGIECAMFGIVFERASDWKLTN